MHFLIKAWTVVLRTVFSLNTSHSRRIFSHWGAIFGCFLTVTFLAASASAGEPTSQNSEQPGEYQFKGQFDGWVLSMDRGTPSAVYICGELPLVGAWSFQGCGSGSGILHRAQPDTIDLTHFRTNYDISLPAGFSAAPGVGLAEVQRGRDEAGFVFEPENRPRTAEASGPEAAVELAWSPNLQSRSLQTLRFKWDAGVAWIPGAPEAVDTSSTIVPFTTITLNGTF